MDLARKQENIQPQQDLQWLARTAQNMRARTRELEGDRAPRLHPAHQKKPWALHHGEETWLFFMAEVNTDLKVNLRAAHQVF